MDQKDRQEFELEDILREFGSQEPEQVPEDTIDLELIQKAVQETLPEPQEPEQAPISQETAVFQPAREPQEPFSEAWEPEYDQPMGECFTAPIPFKPKSRPQQLRAKLVAGPEKRYYDLSERGFGKLQVGIFLNFLIFVLAVGSTVLYTLGFVSPERLRLLVYIQLLCMLVAALVGCYRILEGLGDLLRLRFTLNTWLAPAFLICAFDGLVCLQQQRICCSALFCLQMLLAQIGEHQRRNTQTLQMDALRNAVDLDAIVKDEAHFDGKPGYVTVPGDPDSFMDRYLKPSGPEKVLSIYSLCALVAALGLGVFAGVREGLAAGSQAAAGALMLAMPATAFIAISRPEGLLQKRLHKLGAVLCGWEGIRAAERKAVYPLDYGDLFPSGMTKLNGVKYYGPMSPDTVVSYATSLVVAGGSGLEPLFRQLLSGRSGQVLTVEDLHRFDGGLSGVIDGIPVSLGTLEFARSLGVELPENTKLPQAVCLSIDGKLAGIFAVNCGRSKSASAGLRTLCSYKGLRPVLRTNDFMLTEDFLARKFSADTKQVIFPTPEQRQSLRDKEVGENAPVIALVSRPGLAQRAFPVTGALVLRSTWKVGVTIHMLGGILGLVAAALLTWTGGLALLTPGNLLLYGILWMIPGWLVSTWTKML